MPAGVVAAGPTGAGSAAALHRQNDGAEPGTAYALGGPLPIRRPSEEPRHRPTSLPRRYTDIELLVQVDEAHESLSGPATRRILEREFRVYGKAEFERLAAISNGHRYNLRRHPRYRQGRTQVREDTPHSCGH